MSCYFNPIRPKNCPEGDPNIDEYIDELLLQERFEAALKRLEREETNEKHDNCV